MKYNTGNKREPERQGMEVLLKRRGIEVREEKWLINGLIRERQVVEIQDAVVILPITKEGKIVLIRNFRVPTKEKWLVELPAGKIDAKPEGGFETPVETARRELSEETGYNAKKLTLKQKAYASPGRLTEMIYTVVAEDLENGAIHREEGEMISDIMEVTLEEALEMIASSQIIDMKTMNAIRGYALEQMNV